MANKERDRTIDEVEKALFDDAGDSSKAWQAQSRDLLRVSHYLVRKSNAVRRARQIDPEDPDLEAGAEYLRAALLLRAFGVECLFKALWLAKGGRLTNAGTFSGIPGLKNTHKLWRLADRLSFSLDPQERDVLERLTVFGEFGRYPIEGSYLSGGLGKRWWSVRDNSTLAAIVGRLRKAVEEEGAPGGGDAS